MFKLFLFLFSVSAGKTRGKRPDKDIDEDATKKKSKKKEEKKPEPEVAPEFVVKPRRQFIDDGAVAKFKASFDGPSTTEIVWSKDGAVLTSDDHYKIYESDGFHYLEVLNVTTKDNGEFTITALNPAGSDTATAELEVFERPKLLTTQMPEWEKPLQDIVVRQGDTAVEITCSSKDLKNPSVRWFHNDTEIFSGFHTKLQHEGQVVKLTIKEVRESDAGQIKCVMTGVNGELESACSVVVRPPEKMEAPVFVKELHDMEVEEGDKLELDVQVKGTPPVEVYWYHNNVAITRDSPHFLLASLGSSVHTLTLPRAARECSGEFVCEAYNAFGDTDTFCRVHVTEVEDPEPPSFVTRPVTLIAQEGESVTLTCRVRGQPIPTVLWERQGVVISSCDKYQPTSLGDDHSLTVTQLDSSDAGLYMCHLHSAIGDASHTCELRIEESHKRSRALSKSLREPLSLGAWDTKKDVTSRKWSGKANTGDELLPSTGADENLGKGVNTENIIGAESNWQTQRLSDLSGEQTFSPSAYIKSEEKEINSQNLAINYSKKIMEPQTSASGNVPIPKPRYQRKGSSQTESQSFQLPNLKPVSVSNLNLKDKTEPDPPIDFRSVLKSRTATQPKPTAGSGSEYAVDFRSVLSKHKADDREYPNTAVGVPRTGAVGLELRNLQMERSSRNVVSRSGEHKFGINSIVASPSPSSASASISSSGSQMPRESTHIRPSAHVNAAGLRIVSKNLDTIDSWEDKPEPLLSARSLNDAGPKYSPSSSSSVSHPSSVESHLISNVASSNHSEPVKKNSLENSNISASKPVAASKAVPRIGENNQTSYLHLQNENESIDLNPSSNLLHSLPGGAHSADVKSDINSSQSKIGNMFTVTGVTRNSKGSLRLAGNSNGSVSSQEDTTYDHKSITTSGVSNIINQDTPTSLLGLEQPLKDLSNPEHPECSQGASEDDDQMPPPALPSSRPPSLPSNDSSKSKSDEPNDEASTACVSYLHFTPSSSSKSSQTSSSLEPVVFKVNLSTTSPSSVLSDQHRVHLPEENVSMEDSTMVSDSSRDDSDDVFADHSDLLEVPEASRRGSIKTEGSVFAWEKIPEKSRETSPVAISKEDTASRSGQTSKKKTSFQLDGAVIEKQRTHAPTRYPNSKSLSSVPQTPPPQSKSKSVSSNSSATAEFRQVKLKSTGINMAGEGDLKKSKFMSTSTESLFFNVKLKPVLIKDSEPAEDSSLAMNAWSIKAKSKSSGDLLRDMREERGFKTGQALGSARDSSKQNMGFSEKLSAFENRGSETDRTEFSRKPNFALPKRNTVSKFISQANRKETDKSKATLPFSKYGGASATAENKTKVTSSELNTRIKRTEFEPPILSSTLPRNHKTSSTKDECGFQPVTQPRSQQRGRHSVDVSSNASSRTETIPSWVKEKAFGKRSSLTVDSKASTLPMSSSNKLQTARDNITKIKDNPNAPKTPRRFKRDKLNSEDELMSTVDEDNLQRSVVGQDKSNQPKINRRKINGEDNENNLLKTSDKLNETTRTNTFGSFVNGVNKKDNSKDNTVIDSKTAPFKSENQNSSNTPEWMQRRNLKPVEPSLKTRNNGMQSGASKESSGRHDRLTQNNKTATPFSSLISKFNKQPTASTSILAMSLKCGSEKAPDPSQEPSRLVNKNRDSKLAETPASSTSKAEENAMNIKQTVNEPASEESTARTQIVIEPPGLTNRTMPDTSSEQADVSCKSNDKEKELPQSVKQDPGVSQPVGTKQVPAHDSSVLNNQTPLRNTNVRPAWKKQRSLRHIPIYPIHDNELSPRYEPFLDDSESTASVSSTSSEASIITNDSGYYSKSRSYHHDLKLHTNEDHQQNIDYNHEHHKVQELQNSDDIQCTQEQDKTESDHDLLGQIDTNESQDISVNHEERNLPKDDRGSEGDYNSSGPHGLINEASTVIEYLTDHDKPSNSNVSNDSNEDGEATLKDVRVVLQSEEKANVEKEREKDTNDTVEFDPESNVKENSDISNDEKRLTIKKPGNETDSEALSPDDKMSTTRSDETNSNSPTQTAPSRQGLNLKNSVAFQESSEGQAGSSDTTLFPRRRSKFMDDYKNGRRGSDENGDLEQKTVAKSDTKTAIPKSLAIRPTALDIVPRWKRSQPASCDYKNQSHAHLDEPLDIGPNEIRLKIAAPEFTTYLEDTMTVVYGSKATLRCTVSGDPCPEVVWLFNRQPLKPSKTQDVSRDGNVAELTISETFAEHEGLYTCQASNPEGTASTSCVLRLAGKR
ncbi:myosin light chain kinase, smooth muscle [Plakobranchus ocellatus]|uniref:Myosin light chain kinase, smooth muscle n=1 Tax=Plakobranchus ocellatus TaxID=259542 RepID=A0AAV4D314_9GAST|nr:myosin light chain kinase, smooth muscle [Plakobranchus ocellatus]